MKKLLFAIFVVTTIISFTSCRNKKEQDKAKQQVEKVKENVNDAVDKVSDKIEDGADAVKDAWKDIVTSYILISYGWICNMDCWISTDYQSRTGNMAYPCTNRKTADSYYLNRSYQLDRIAVLLFLRQGTNAAMAGYWSSKILATSESNIYMNIILNMGEYSKSQ